ncbi:MAG: HAD-IA family hydrolase [Anaerolineales bacterium]|nr:HAD-IA family hydrolase [Anaerolineales bacterium]
MSFECDAILFDLDGVLLDSSECVKNTWRIWGQQRGIPFEKIMAVAYGRRAVETIRLVAPHLDADEEVRPLSEWEAVTTEGIYAIDGASTLVRALPPDGWAVVTSGTRDIAVTRMKCTGLPIPNFMVTADDVVNGKPDPEPYCMAAERMKILPEKCVVVEDSPAGIEAAHKAGMYAIGVAFSHPREALSMADVIANKLSDIQVSDGKSRRFLIEISA